MNFGGMGRVFGRMGAVLAKIANTQGLAWDDSSSVEQSIQWDDESGTPQDIVWDI